MAPERRWRLIAMGLLVCTVAACRDGAVPDPAGLPFRVEPRTEFSHPATPVDLDRDGSDEIVYRYRPRQDVAYALSAVVLRSADLQTIDQVNYQGRLEPLEFIDTDGDGNLEILVPIVRNDSLYYSIVGADA